MHFIQMQNIPGIEIHDIITGKEKLLRTQLKHFSLYIYILTQYFDSIYFYLIFQFLTYYSIYTIYIYFL